MSTAVGHGLADPKTRGKPVSHANEGRRLCLVVAERCVWSNPGVFRGPAGQGKTRAAPVPKGIPVKIPEPEGWTERRSLCSLGLFGCWATGARTCLAGRGSKRRSLGGNAKPTFGILFVTPGRDLFSF